MGKENRTGVVLKGIGGFYYVLSDGQLYECKAGGRLRFASESPLAGDRVEFSLDGKSALITALFPRKNVLVRPPIANIDRLFIVASEAPPTTDPFLIDKVLVIAARQGIEPVLLLNKSDLVGNRGLQSVYRSASVPVITVSAVTDEGIEEVCALLAGCISAFTGNSGIGKSSILNRIDARFALSVGNISEKIGRGRHTTRKVELLPLRNGGFVADTPGFSSFEITKIDRIKKDELQLWFPELEERFGQCRYNGCAHIHEPDCAVRDAVSRGEIALSRYESYCKLYAELAQLKEWET